MKRGVFFHLPDQTFTVKQPRLNTARATDAFEDACHVKKALRWEEQPRPFFLASQAQRLKERPKLQSNVQTQLDAV